MIRFICFLSLLFAACSRKDASASKQVARISIQSEPASLDPRKARDLDGGVLLRMLFEGLMRSSKELAIADKVEISDDGLKYVFHLREARWSNGEPLQASDFIFAWSSILDPQFPTDIAYHLYPIKNARKAKLGEIPLCQVGICAIDSQTLLIELEQPTPYFLELLTMPPFFPVPKTVVMNNPNWAQEASSFVSNGPFQMERWDHADQLIFKKNPLYWDAAVVRLQGINLCIATSDTGLRMFEENKLDWMGSPLSTIPIDAIGSLKEFTSSPFSATGFCRVNVHVGDLSKVQFRRALALSLDRSSIVKHLLRGGQTAAMSLVPSDMGLCPDGYFSDNSLDEALALLNQARRETPFAPLVISYKKDERNALIAQALQTQWQERLGLTVDIESVESKVFFQRISRKEFQIAIGSWTADFNDPINFLEVFKFKDNGTNNTGWENSEYIDLLNRSELCRDLQERKEILRKAEKILMEEMPIVPIYQFALNYIKNGALTGVSLSPQGHLDLRTASFERKEPCSD